MSPTVIAALVAAASALAVALYNAVSGYRREQKLRELGFSYDTKLEDRKSELSREDAMAKARTEYEYNARLSLYQRFEPLLFQLVGLADYALDRIKNLTEPSVWAEFVLVPSPRKRAVEGHRWPREIMNLSRRSTGSSLPWLSSVQ